MGLLDLFRAKPVEWQSFRLRHGFPGIDVAGESHYQPAIRSLVTEEQQENGGKTKAVAHLRCDPNNPYDSHAVMGLIDGLQVGFLPAHHAGDYQPIVKGATTAHCHVEVEAAIVGGGYTDTGVRKNIGVFLNVARAEKCLPDHVEVTELR